MKKAIACESLVITHQFNRVVKIVSAKHMFCFIKSTQIKLPYFSLVCLIVMFTSCKKLVSIADPTDKIINDAVFSTDDLANSAVNGIYNNITTDGFAWGASALYGALSSDELISIFSTFDQLYPLNTNHLSIIVSQGAGTAVTDNIWSSAYSTIYASNAVIEGIVSSTSGQLSDSARKLFTAEAKFIRAFCYFYLTNFYGDVPLLLTTNYNETIVLSRSPQTDVYKQIVEDLEEAENNLSADYVASGGRRVRVNKWAAAALLARVYLYNGDNANATAKATTIIDNTDLYTLELNVDDVFLTTSREAIWQLNQKTNASSNDATPDGNLFSAGGLDTAFISYGMSSMLLGAFETGDSRLTFWVDSTVLSNLINTKAYYPSKYKVGSANSTLGGDPTQYYTVLRLAEQYLIRAEAEANGAGDGPAAAIEDLNTIRSRAGLSPLSSSLTGPDLVAAVAHEWQTEFFCEWGHRWFNLKRTGQAHDVLSIIPLKQPWAGDYQLLYPIPQGDIRLNPNLSQNQDY